ncbi:glycoside hydrolase family 16 protein [Hymenobacter roseosalivarius]|uniref:glycoside hydrolase family 16 protein n=1 Tax=Hymenobacter roseosalivarius TaxID=89967 RepID=UPI0013566D09|nr:glycoside hydrolase family 16 protein [Hymenobacter roseosalivarius]
MCNYNQPTAKEAELLAAGWKKTFEDNFDVSPNNSLNPNWNVWVGGAFNNELQMFTASTRNLNVTADRDDAANNVLVIKAIKESVTGPKYRQDVDATPTNFEFTSARIESKTLSAPTKNTSQIRFVSRIKLPSGYGMWPAFWLYGNNWPTNGEIDILEARGNEPFLFQTNYFFGRQANVNLVQNAAIYVTTETSLTDWWHVYELI